MHLGGGNPKVDVLKRVPLFASCSKHDLEEIGRITDELDLVEGRELIAQGERGQQFFVLLDGSADVHRNGEKINELHEGDFFGELSLISDRATTATVTATSPVRVLVITPQNFRRLMRESESVQVQILSALAQRLPRDGD